jgi:exonuclease SbcD
MKIIHFADLHLGVENYGNINPETGLPTRLEDFLAAFDEMVDYAIAVKADLALFCGDAYKTREPTQTQQREFAKRISRMATAGIPVFILTGNHDLPNAIGRATATEIFDTLSIKNVYVASKPDIYKIVTAGGTIQIVALPWLRRSALLLPAVLAAHVSVSDAKVGRGSESLMSIGREPALLLGNIALPVFDYIALGHIHKHQVLNEHPPVVYAGSMERVDFGEEKEDKGFYVIDITNNSTGEKQVTYEFHPVKARRFTTIDVEIKNDEPDPTASILNVIRTQPESISNAVVRLNITVPATMENQIRNNELKEALKESHIFTITPPKVIKETRSRIGNQPAEDLTPADALKAWMENSKIPQERQKVLLEYADKLIAGQEPGV